MKLLKSCHSASHFKPPYILRDKILVPTNETTTIHVRVCLHHAYIDKLLTEQVIIQFHCALDCPVCATGGELYTIYHIPVVNTQKLTSASSSGSDIALPLYCCRYRWTECGTQNCIAYNTHHPDTAAWGYKFKNVNFYLKSVSRRVVYVTFYLARSSQPCVYTRVKCVYVIINIIIIFCDFFYKCVCYAHITLHRLQN